MKANYFLCLIIGLSSSYYLAAQKLEGRVLDENTMKPLSGALIIFKKSDTNFTGRVLADEKGIYKFPEQIEEGNYDLEVSSEGYQKKGISVSIFKDNFLDISLSTVSLSTVSHELEEVVIVKQKTKIEQSLDKKVINVGKDLLSGGGDALTVLERVPEIQSDSNGNISLRGDKNVTVLVNGKPSSLSATELLRQISASNINKIEIITSPSAKYTASGLTGIINIVTNKKVLTGLSVNNSATANSLGGYTGDADVSIGSEKMSYSFGIGYVKGISKNKSLEHRQNIDPLTIENKFKFERDTYKAKGKINWFINKTNELSVDLNYADNSHGMFFDRMISQKDVRTPQKDLSSLDFKTFDFTTNYRHVFSKSENYLDLDLYISNSADLTKNDYQKNTNQANNATDEVVTVSRASADYTAKVNETIKLEAGLLLEKQDLDNSFSILPSENITATGRQFKNVQNTYASYGMLKFDINKFNFQTGLRGEIFQRDAHLITENTKIDHEYINLFPSLHVGYNISEGKTMSFGFNRRTTRPSLSQVNPNPYQHTRFVSVVGSPDLRPEFSNNFDINFQLKKSSFNIITGLSYRLKEDLILQNTSIDEKGITIYKPFNGSRSNAFGVDFSSTVTPLKWWDATVSMNWNYEIFSQDDVFLFRNFSTNYSTTLQNDIKFSSKLEFGLTWKYNSAEKSYVSDSKKVQYVDIALRYKVMKNNGNITLRFADIFNTRVYEGQDYGVDFVNKYRFKPMSRVVYLSFAYNFKKGKKITERNIKTQDYKKEES